MAKRNCQTANPLFPSHATIFTLSTLAISCASRNSTSFNMKVHTLSQKRYVFSLPACKTVSILISSRMSFSFRRWNNGSLSPDVVVAVTEFIVNFLWWEVWLKHPPLNNITTVQDKTQDTNERKPEPHKNYDETCENCATAKSIIIKQNPKTSSMQISNIKNKQTWKSTDNTQGRDNTKKLK